MISGVRIDATLWVKGVFRSIIKMYYKQKKKETIVDNYLLRAIYYSKVLKEYVT